MEHVILIHPNGPGLQAVSNAERRVQIGGVNGGREAVGGGIADLDGILFRFEFRNGTHRAENFFLDYFHVVADVGEDGGFDKVANVAVTFAAGFDLGSCFFTGVDVSRIMSAHELWQFAIYHVLHDAIVLKL